MESLVLFLFLQASIDLSPGHKFYWYQPCVIQASDVTNPVEQLAKRYLKEIGSDLTVTRCVQPANNVYPVLKSEEIGDTFLIIYNDVMQRPGFDRLALRGLIAHEVAHLLAEPTCYRPFYHQWTEEEHLDCESAVDRHALQLAGHWAVRAALLKFYQMQIEMTYLVQEQVEEELIEERLRRLSSERLGGL